MLSEAEQNALKRNPLLGGISYQQVAASRAESESEREVIRLIILREEVLLKIRQSVRNIARREKIAPQLLGFLQVIRELTLQVIENIERWRRKYLEPREFVWNGRNYLLTIPSTLNFLDRFHKLVSWFGFHLVRNPFLLPAMGPGLPPPSENAIRHAGDTSLSRVREAEGIIFREESTYGLWEEEDRLCSWCGMITPPKPKGKRDTHLLPCDKCRTVYCRSCIEENMKPQSLRTAIAGQPWMCFVCEWKRVRTMMQAEEAKLKAERAAKRRAAKVKKELRLRKELRASLDVSCVGTILECRGSLTFMRYVPRLNRLRRTFWMKSQNQ